MGKLIVTEFMTLDGVAQAPGAPEEDTASGFRHGGWQAPLLDAGSGGAMFERAKDMDALLLGRRTYDIFAAYWPSGPSDEPFTALLNRVPKYVASRTLAEPLSWEKSSLLDGDLAAAVSALKQQHENLHAIGSLDLLQSLLRHGLVDELRLWQYPVLLGDGKRVFEGGVGPETLRLARSTAYDNGTLELVYEPQGVAPTYGTIGA